MIYTESIRDKNIVFVVLGFNPDEPYLNVVKWLEIALWLSRSDIPYLERSIVRLENNVYYPNMITLSREDAVIFKLRFGGRTLGLLVTDAQDVGGDRA